MKCIKWPMCWTDNQPDVAIRVGTPGILPDTPETLIVDAGGMYGLLPKPVMANVIDQLAAIKKAEGTKSLWPSVVLRFDQVVPISPEAAKVLLDE